MKNRSYKKLNLRIGIWFLTILCPVLLSAQTVTKGPYLLVPGKTSVSILWETDAPAGGQIIGGTGASHKFSVNGRLLGQKDGGYLYQAAISGLQPGQEYTYRLKLRDVSAAVHRFRTAPPDDGPFSFVAMGDSRSNPDIFRVINEQVNRLNPDLIISMGDLVAEGGNYAEWGKYYFKPAAQVIDHIPLISTLGDHEGSSDNGDLFRYFLLPEMKTERLWFSFDYGPAHFVSLDYRYPDSQEMIDWFRKDMSHSNAKWTFVYMHRPCYNLGGHRSNWGKGIWPALFREYKVDIVFGGHSHEYERFYPVRPAQEPESWPVTYITTGGAGAGLYDVVSNRFLAEAKSLNHFIQVKISGDSLSLSARKMDDSVFDILKIVKHNGKLDKQYLAKVEPQEQLNLVNMFARALTFSVSALPVDSRPLKKNIYLESDFNKDIEFELRLSDSSDVNYTMKPISGTLKARSRTEVPVEISRKGDITISQWGEIFPPLGLSAVFSTYAGAVSVAGSSIEYWPAGE